MKKILSLLLSFCLLLSCAFAAEAGQPEIAKAEKENPVIVVRGMDFTGGLQYDRGTENAKAVTPEIDAEGIFKTLAEMSAAVFLPKGRTPVQVLCDYVYTVLEGYACDENGDSLHKNITAASYPLSAGNYPEFSSHGGTDEYGLTSSLVDRYGGEKVYYFVYDWRLDPWDNAVGLDSLIKTALEENSAAKADIICCSMGGSIVMAYLARYGSDNIDMLISNSSVMGGADVVSDLFQGKVYFEPLAVENKLKDALPAASGFITLLSKTKILDMMCRALNNFAEKNKRELFDRALIPTLATLPGFWSAVDAEDYAACREYVFGGNTEKYAGLLKRIDRFYEKVSSKRGELLRNAVDNGMRLAVIANYNTPLVCAYERAAYQGDGVVDTRPMSLGAAVSKIGCRLSDEELSDGNPKYISADKCINASSCLFPDYTWFGKDAGHVVGNYNSDYTNFIFKLLECSSQPTVDTWEEYPQFMQSGKDEQLSPLAAE